MARPRLLRNAPITEAVIDLYVKLPPEIGLDQLLAAGMEMKHDYPQYTRHLLFEHRIQVRDGKSEVTSAEPTPDGWLFRWANGTQVFQSRLDGFSFNRLKPYEGWGPLRDEARRLWAVYARHALPEFVTRVSVRFINHIEVSLPIRDFGEILASPVPMPLDQGAVCGFLTRVSVSAPGVPVIATTTQVFDPGPGESRAALILDIEATTVTQVPMAPDEAWAAVDSLRELKNRCFFGSLTDQAIEAYA